MKITRIGVSDGNDSIVILRDLGDIPGGRTLDFTGFTGAVRAGHIIIKKANGDYAPLGVESMAYVDLSTGDEYAGVLKKSVTKKDPRAAIMTSGIVNYKALPYEIDGAIAAGLNDILFAGYVPGEEPGPTPPTPPTPTDGPMYFEAAEANSTIGMMSTLETAPSLEYSTDGYTWQAWGYTTADDTHTFDTITLGAVGDRVYFRGDNQNGLADIQSGNVSIFQMTGKINAGGNVMSLIDKTMELTELPDGCFGMLFSVSGGDEPALLTPPSMQTITSIGDYGCINMYRGCTFLTSAAAMSALTSIGDYGCVNMYYDCSSLKSAADMPALTNVGGEGCLEMYTNCTFDMSDDGTTLNFAFPTPPVTVGSETLDNAHEVAAWMGNTNGFTEP